MLDKHDIRDVMLREIDVCVHLHGKLPQGALEYRPGPGQRSTLELLRYLSHCGVSGTRAMLEGNWNGFKENAARAETMSGDQFPAAMERQKQELIALFEKLTPEQFATQAATMPMGEKLKLGRALLEAPFRWLCGYRLQLFLYAKAAGAKDIATANCWMGVDRPAPK